MPGKAPLLIDECRNKVAKSEMAIKQDIWVPHVDG